MASTMGSPFDLAAGGSGIPVGRMGLKSCFGFAATQKNAHRIVPKRAVQFRERLMGGNLAAEFSGTQAIEWARPETRAESARSRSLPARQ